MSLFHIVVMKPERKNMSSDVAGNAKNNSMAPIGASNVNDEFPDTVFQITTEDVISEENPFAIPFDEVREVIIQDMYDSLLTILRQHSTIASQIGITVNDISEVLGKATAKSIHEIRDVDKVKSKYDTMVYFHDANKAFSEGFNEEKDRIILNIEIK